jgi:hypothetical protein
MANRILMDELHVTLFAPPRLRAAAYRAIRQTLDGNPFRTAPTARHPRRARQVPVPGKRPLHAVAVIVVGSTIGSACLPPKFRH